MWCIQWLYIYIYIYIYILYIYIYIYGGWTVTKTQGLQRNMPLRIQSQLSFILLLKKEHEKAVNFFQLGRTNKPEKQRVSF